MCDGQLFRDFVIIAVGMLTMRTGVSFFSFSYFGFGFQSRAYYLYLISFELEVYFLVSLEQTYSRNKGSSVKLKCQKESSRKTFSYCPGYYCTIMNLL